MAGNGEAAGRDLRIAAAWICLMEGRRVVEEEGRSFCLGNGERIGSEVRHGEAREEGSGILCGFVLPMVVRDIGVLRNGHLQRSLYGPLMPARRLFVPRLDLLVCHCSPFGEEVGRP